MSLLVSLRSSWTRSFRAEKSFVWRQRVEWLYRLQTLRPARSKPTLDCVVSLTSYPKRFKYLHLVIKALLLNSMLPKKIILYLDKNELAGHEIPRSLRRLEGDRFFIRTVDSGYRSFSKLLHALEEFPEENILTVDDDYLYDRDFLATFEPHIEDPTVRVATGLGKEIVGNAEMKFQDARLIFSGASDRAILLGFTGVLYKPGALSPLVHDTDLFQRLCPHNDDLWFTWCALQSSGARIHIAGIQPSRNKEIFNPITPRLMDQNGQGRMDREWSNLLLHFGQGA